MPDRNPRNFRFLMIPFAISSCRELTRLEQCVWGVVYSTQELRASHGAAGPTNISNRQIADRLGSDRRSVSKAVGKLIDAGFLRSHGRCDSNVFENGTRRVSVLIPDELDCDRWLKNLEPIDVHEDDEGGSSNGRGVVEPTTGGRRTDDRGSSNRRHGGRRIDDVDKGSLEEDRVTPRGAPGVETPDVTRNDPSPRRRNGRTKVAASRKTATASSPRAEPSPPPGYGDEDEIQVPVLDGESRQTGEEIERERERRREVRASKRAKPRGGGDDDLLRTPSKRPSLNAWRERGVVRGIHLVGYFVAKYVEAKGEEPREFFATEDAIRRSAVSLANAYVKRWFGGDFSKGVALVDKIFERAEERGMPLKFAYFFTPGREGAALRLDEERPRGRPEAPYERNDRRGNYDANKEFWDEQAERNREIAERKVRELEERCGKR